ncbi:hypothetical protein TcCL_ESM03741 [Trypanosoma cruzi]|nr:hypothetical protein TcCL_ESM03741 [Trypanosoma cruzi]
MCPFVSVDGSGVFHFPGTSQAAVREGGVDHRSVRAAGGGCKMAQKLIHCAAGDRDHARQTIADGRGKRTRREGPIHIPVTRGHASTKCDNSGDRSTCNTDSVTEERVAIRRRITSALTSAIHSVRVPYATRNDKGYCEAMSSSRTQAP